MKMTKKKFGEIFGWTTPQFSSQKQMEKEMLYATQTFSPILFEKPLTCHDKQSEES